jgi:hypothetical protein
LSSENPNPTKQKQEVNPRTSAVVSTNIFKYKDTSQERISIYCILSSINGDSYSNKTRELGSKHGGSNQVNNIK